MVYSYPYSQEISSMHSAVLVQIFLLVLYLFLLGRSDHQNPSVSVFVCFLFWFHRRHWRCLWWFRSSRSQIRNMHRSFLSRCCFFILFGHLFCFSFLFASRSSISSSYPSTVKKSTAFLRKESKDLSVTRINEITEINKTTKTLPAPPSSL